MRKINLIILVAVLFIFTGCASSKKAVSETTPEQTSSMAAMAAPYIPQPYQLPASVLLGWLACIGYNWFKDKTKSKES